MISVAALSGCLVGLVLVPLGVSSGGSHKAPEVRLLGTPLLLNDNAKDEALGRVRRLLKRSFALRLPGGEVREFPMARLGVELDRARLARLVRDAKDETSALRRKFRPGPDHPALTLPTALSVNLEAAVPTLLGLKDKLDRAPVDARLDLTRRVTVPEVEGRFLDVDRTLHNIRQALAEGTLSANADFELTPPKRRASELGAVKFDRALAQFETNYDRSQRFEARAFNLRLAASKLDGTVLLPGETFDFNEVVGPRDEANGYKVAHVIAEGELVDGIGGGTCQISGTLHGAAFFAGLDIVERYPHTRPSAYIKLGLDATVVYPTINFRVKNPYPFPVVLHETVSNGRVQAAILGPERARTVTLIRRIEGVIPYEEVERPDENLPTNTRVLAQRGVPGFKLRRYRIIRDGAHAVRERFRDVYPPTTQIIRVGSGEAPRSAANKPKDDPSPEYLADELLVMTQGDGDEISERREPGPYAERGWTEKAGMPLFEPEAKASSEKKR